MTLKAAPLDPDPSILLDIAPRVSELAQSEAKFKLMVSPAILGGQLDPAFLIPNTQQMLKSVRMYLISFQGHNPPLPLPPPSKPQGSPAKTPVPVPRLISLLLLESHVPEDTKGQ